MTRLWKVALGANGQFEAAATEKDVLTIDFGITSDLAQAKDREALVAVLENIHPAAKSKTLLNFAAQVNQFVNVMMVGDIAVCPMKNSGTFWIGRVSGAYSPDAATGMPTRFVTWLRTNIPREAIKQDLRFSFGAFMTVCEITRNNALSRIEAVIKTGVDPGDGLAPALGGTTPPEPQGVAEDAPEAGLVDLAQLATDQIEERIASSFAGHGLTQLIKAILEAQGMKAHISPPGPDKGLDIVAGSGALGLERPRIAVQVKSGNEVVDQPTLQSLIGTVHDTQADHGLLVSWGGFKQTVQKRTNELYFRIRFWGRKEIMENLFAVYDRLPEEIRAELPLRRTWMVVPDESEMV